MFSAVASGIFAYRNADKTKNGEIGRSAVTLGQTAGLLQEVAKYDGLAANAARSTLSVFSNLAKQNKMFEYAGKATQFAVNNVNPLICASGVIKTAMSDDKVGTGVTEAAALSAMFAGEGLIKQYYDKTVNSKTCNNLIEKASDKKYITPVFEYLEKHKLKGKTGAVIKGLVFVGGSMSSYAVGQNLGKDISKRVKANLGIKTEEKEPETKIKQEEDKKQKINRMV